MVAGFWVGFFSFSPPLSPLLDYSWPSTVPVCIRARTHPTGTLSGISKITIFTALTFLPSSIILTVLQKETSKTINSALPLNMALLLLLLLLLKKNYSQSAQRICSFPSAQSSIYCQTAFTTKTDWFQSFSNCIKHNLLTIVEKQQINKQH